MSSLFWWCVCEQSVPAGEDNVYVVLAPNEHTALGDALGRWYNKTDEGGTGSFAVIQLPLAVTNEQADAYFRDLNRPNALDNRDEALL